MTQPDPFRARAPRSHEKTPRQGGRFRPGVEALEGRILLNTDTLVIPLLPETAAALKIDPSVRKGFAPEQNLATPGAATQTVPTTFTLQRHKSGFRDEMGIFPVDDAAGGIGSVHPGAPG
jgi:hypothetical protein